MMVLALSGLFVLLSFATVFWCFSLINDDAGVADIAWGPACALAGVVYAILSPALGARASIVLVLVLLWALRLAVFVAWRNHGEPEDRRYRAMREDYGDGWRSASLPRVFLLQGFLAWLISAPLFGIVTAADSALTWLDYLGLSLGVFGLMFESIADWQLSSFNVRPENAKGVMNSGLWKYSRHPNYFGEFCFWWGVYLVALSAGAVWTLVGTALLTFFLFKVSGIGLTEKTIKKRRPDYQAYIDNTSAFLPLPPKHS